ncbi:nuclear polyadenylated RNA-binding protein 3-like [Quillaja saponaria]|uniref:Nuclear polyadenylated RNA-binding protein 3-like n=1 Tax=Quillaja saponaria TaxID=32244 RepID=A0AAD7QBR2_QUISA|nr:nuclear polyadenylated RNA-binding protein 3-like [Quillaja saponaria]
MGKQSDASSSASMEFLLAEEVDYIVVEEDALSDWEFVNAFDGEQRGEQHNDVQNGHGSLDSSISWLISQKNSRFEGLLHYDMDVKEHHDQIDDGIKGVCQFGVNDRSVGLKYDDGDADVFGGRQSDNDDDDEYDDDNRYDLDDELVPWSVSSKFGRQRMRKLGKRACSKKSPYLFVRPGCVRGKHGLGLKHSI